MDAARKEAQLVLAIQAIKSTPVISIRRAAAIYNVPYSTLNTRIHGIQSRRDSIPKSQKLTEQEEYTIVQRVLELNSQAFPPRLSAVEDMANRLLREREASRVGKN